MQGVFYRVFQSAAAAAMVGLAACSGPTDPGKKPDAPVITCPANITVRGVAGGSQPVSFTPTVAGGTVPINTTCTPASGASFSVGAAAVSCTAVDASARQSQCAFTVTLTPLLLSVTKFVAFGDSLTKGENGRRGFHGQPIIDEPNAYPTQLQSMLDLEYPGQRISVLNEGVGGEPVESAKQRLPGVLATDRPDALLLLDGYNDLLAWCKPPVANTPECAATIDNVVARIRDMIQVARTTRYVFVSTLTPPGPFAGGVDNRQISGIAISQTNAKLAPMVRAQGAVLVDTYPTFIGHEPEYVDQDGLHLKPAGYQALAQSFFNTIKSTVTSTPGLRDTYH